MNRILTALFGLLICAPAMAQIPTLRTPSYDTVTLLPPASGTVACIISRALDRTVTSATSCIIDSAGNVIAGPASVFSTPTAGDNSTKPATTAFVAGAIATVGGSIAGNTTAIATEATRATAAEALAIPLSFIGANPVALPPSSQAYFNLSPRLHLAKFGASATPTVCLVGDSKSQNFENSVSRGQSMWQTLKTRIAAQNPTKTITFDNFAIGGQTWLGLNSTVVNTPNVSEWTVPQDITKSWLGNVQAGNCTSIFISLGFNDGNNLNSNDIKSVLTKIVAFTPVPDIILMTPEVFDPAYPQSGLGPLGTLGTIAAQSYIRTLAENGGSYTGIANLPPIGLIDFGRTFQQQVLGVDYADQYLTQSASFPAGTQVSISTPMTLSPPTAGDFAFNITVPGHAADLLTASGATLAISLPSGVTVPSVQLVTTGVGGAYYGVTTDGATGGFAACPVHAPVVAGPGDFSIDFSIIGSRMRLKIQGITLCELNFPHINGGAPFSPVVSLTGSSVSNAVYSFVQPYAYGTPQQYAPTLTPTQCFGPVGAAGPGGGSGPTGGNGAQHNATQCTQIEKRVLDQVNFNTN